MVVIGAAVVGEWAMLFVNALVPRMEVGEVEREVGDEDMEVDGEEKYDARPPVTRSDDPLSGGHLTFGASKAPTGTSRERGRVIVHAVVALDVANSERTRHRGVEGSSPISNALTSVDGAKTRFLI